MKIVYYIIFIGFLFFTATSCELNTKKAINNSDPVNGLLQSDAIIDLTKPPYNLDNTGKEDCSDAFIRAVNDVAKDILRRYRLTDSILNATDTTIGFEARSGLGTNFPHKSWPTHILYLPNGVYKVSKTITYQVPNLQNRQGSEMNRQIRIMGQSKDGTIIKLADNTPEFGKGKNKPVLSFMREPNQEVPDLLSNEPVQGIHGIRGAHSNVAMSNYCENMTIDIGAGNPGAIGLLFHSSNTGAIRNMHIKSSDPELRGCVGLALPMGKPMGNYGKNISIYGFDYGILINDHMLYSVFEHIHLKDQLKAGIRIFNHPVTVRGLQSENKVPAVEVIGDKGYLALSDSKLQGNSNGEVAIKLDNGFCYLENIAVNGYTNAVAGDEVNNPLPIGKLEKYTSHPIENFNQMSPLQLPVRETPYSATNDPVDSIAFVDDYGAVGDGKEDDTEAIRKAMQSGKKVVVFQPGQYLLNETIEIPDNVERVNFMFCDLRSGSGLTGEIPNFRVIGESDKPLIIEDLMAWEQYFGEFYFVDHASKRTLILSDLHFQVAAVYRNSVSGGEVFIENVGNTTGETGVPRPCYVFNGQKVWARQFNPERADPEVVNNGSDLWILGFKTEMGGTSFVTKNGGRTEVVGGVINNYGHSIAPGKPVLITSKDSQTSITAVTNGRSQEGHYFKVFSVEHDEPVLRWEHVPRRYENQSVITFYSTLTK